MGKEDKENKEAVKPVSNPKANNAAFTVVRNFAFGDPVVQYKKGGVVMLSPECERFAVKNKTVVSVK